MIGGAPNAWGAPKQQQQPAPAPAAAAAAPVMGLQGSGGGQGGSAAAAGGAGNGFGSGAAAGPFDQLRRQSQDRTVPPSTPAPAFPPLSATAAVAQRQQQEQQQQQQQQQNMQSAFPSLSAAGAAAPSHMNQPPQQQQQQQQQQHSTWGAPQQSSQQQPQWPLQSQPTFAAADNVQPATSNGGGGLASPMGRVGTFHHLILHSKHQSMTAGTVHVTNRTSANECNPTDGQQSRREREGGGSGGGCRRRPRDARAPPLRHRAAPPEGEAAMGPRSVVTPIHLAPPERVCEFFSFEFIL
jgi:hypothetical protein